MANETEVEDGLEGRFKTMDAMALLCTLHADGPATLKGLRQAGCTSLEGIEAMDEERLARILGAPAAAARRFAREARHLRERLGQGPMDREESGDPACAAAIAPAQPAPPPDARPEAESEDLPPRRARPEFEFGVELAAAMREIVETPEPEPEAEPAPMLRPGDLDGLDEASCQKLLEAGIGDLVELSRIDPLVLSGRIGLGYTQVWRLVSLARRAVATRPDEPETVLIPVEPPLRKMSPAEFASRPEPSILELEWSRSAPGSPDSPADEAARESAGGPFA